MGVLVFGIGSEVSTVILDVRVQIRNGYGCTIGFYALWYRCSNTLIIGTLLVHPRYKVDSSMLTTVVVRRKSRRSRMDS